MKFQRFAAEELLLPGVPYDYWDTEVWELPYKEIMSLPRTIEALKADKTPLPTPEAREMYFGERHLAFWLSGRHDYLKIAAATGIDKIESPRILDHGGASGRVVRHFVQEQPNGTYYLSDSNLQHIRLVNFLFRGDVIGIVNDGLPSLPLRERSIDLVTLISVMTHIAEADAAWLCEFDRIVRPGGYVYATIHDEDVWSKLRGSGMKDSLFADPDFAAYYDKNPTPTESVIHFYSDASSNNCNVFHTKDYIHERWGRFFDIISIETQAHAHQAAVVMKSKQPSSRFWFMKG